MGWGVCQRVLGMGKADGPRRRKDMEGRGLLQGHLRILLELLLRRQAS